MNLYDNRAAWLCGLTIAGWLSGCGSGETNLQEEKQPAQKETATSVFRLKKGRLSSSLKVPGELIAYQQVDLYAKENSFVKDILVDVGSEVKKGQLLVSLDAPELGSQLAGALSGSKSREAVYVASKANYDRLLATSQTPGTISPNDLEQAAARRDANLADWQSAKAAYRQIEETQNYLKIKAPFNGVITARNANPGAYVGPSGKGSEMPLFTLQEQRRLRLVISVPETYSSYLGQNTEVIFTVRALPEQHFKAQVKRLAGAIDNRLHSQRIEIDVTNNDKKLLPGMVAEVNLPLPSNDSTLVAPKSAVVNSTESVFVIRVTNGKAEWVPVTVGREANGEIEIHGNLNTGDTLLTAATDEIRNGSAVGNTRMTEK